MAQFFFETRCINNIITSAYEMCTFNFTSVALPETLFDEKSITRRSPRHGASHPSSQPPIQLAELDKAVLC